jgi:ribonuclease D
MSTENNELTLSFPSQIHDVTDSQQASSALKHLGNELAVDVEADAMFRFDARLCFVQVGTAENIFLFDTLAAAQSIEVLKEKFLDANVVKYFHAAQGDLMYLAEAGIRVNGLFDTHRAVTLLQWPKVGLVDLVRQFCGAELKKEHQQADFSLRPLPPQLREYISDDVKYLTYVGQQVRQKCAETDILEEVLLDCQRFCDEATVRKDPLDFLPKVPKKKSPAENIFAYHFSLELHRLRLQWAKDKDVPLGRLLSNAAMVALATHPPKDAREMAKLEGVRGAFAREYGERVLSLMETLTQKQSQNLLTPIPMKKLQTPVETRRGSRLAEWRKKVGEERKVSQSVVLTNPLMDELTVRPPRNLEELSKVKYFGEKRLALYGKALLDVLKDS